MLRKTVVLKLISWVVFSPTIAMAADNLHVANTAQLDALYRRATATFLAADDPTEFVYTIDRDGSMSRISSSHDRARNTVTVDRDTVGLVHTHPKGCAPEPSRGDQDLATNEGIDVYALSVHALWVAHPYGKRPEKIGEVSFEHGHTIVK